MEDLLKRTSCTCTQKLAHIKWHSTDCQYRMDWLDEYQSYYMSDESLYIASTVLSLNLEHKFRGDYTDLLDREFMRRTEVNYNYLEDVFSDPLIDEEPVLYQEVTKPLVVPNKLLVESTSYVYVVFVDGELKYIGKGKGSRYRHTISGASSVAELNRDLFTGKDVQVRFVSKGLTDQVATLLERDLIGSAQVNYSLYNKLLPSKYLKVDVETLLKESY